MRTKPIFRHGRTLGALALCAGLLSGCGGGSGDSGTTGIGGLPGLKSLSGVAVDGYLQGAQVFLDLNRNGVADGGEPSTSTGLDGRYTLDYSALQSDIAGLPIVVTGGIDSDTGFAFTGKLSAPVERARSAQVVSPLTTLVDSMVAQGLVGDVEAGKQKLATALGLSPELIAADPVAVIVTQPAVYTKAVALQRSIQMLARANARPDEASHETHERVIKALARTVAAQASPVDVDRIVADAGLSQSQAAQQLAAAISRSVRTGVEQDGHAGAKIALKAMDEIRTKMETDDDYDLVRAARAIDADIGRTGSRPYTRIVEAPELSRTDLEAVRSVSGTTQPTVKAPTHTAGRLLASNCFQCHGTDGRGGFDDIRGKEAAEIREYLNQPAGRSIMAAHAQGYTTAQIESIIQYLKQ